MPRVPPYGAAAKVKWEPPPGDHLVCFKWTHQEELVAVFEKGCVAVYDVHGHSIQRTFVLEASVGVALVADDLIPHCSTGQHLMMQN